MYEPGKHGRAEYSAWCQLNDTQIGALTAYEGSGDGSFETQRFARVVYNVGPSILSGNVFIGDSVGLNNSGDVKVQGDQLKVYDGQLVSTNANLSSLSSQFVNANANLVAISGLNNDSKAQLISVNSNLVAVSGQLVTANANLVAISGLNASAASQLVTVNSNLVSISGLNVGAGAQLVSIDSRLATANANLSALQAQNDGLSALLARLVGEYAKCVTVSALPSLTATYTAKALPGTTLATAAWQVSRSTVSGSVTTVEWADGDALFDNAANDVSSLNYL